MTNPQAAHPQDDFSKEYSENSLWDKITRYAKVAGEGVTIKVLELYYALMSPETPAWAKAVIVAALGYFISPADAIPDVVPAAGYADDLGVLTAALATVATSITEEVKAVAQARYKNIFGK